MVIQNEEVSLADLQIPAKVAKPDQATLPLLSPEELRPPPSVFPNSVSRIHFQTASTLV